MIYIFDNNEECEDRTLFFVEEPASFEQFWLKTFSPWQDALLAACKTSNMLTLLAKVDKLVVLDDRIKLRKFNHLAGKVYYVGADGKRVPPLQWEGSPEPASDELHPLENKILGALHVTDRLLAAAKKRRSTLRSEHARLESLGLTSEIVDFDLAIVEAVVSQAELQEEVLPPKKQEGGT